jgi:D-alanyl-D-alanine carboxypeptidase (penicillin-binding protein 5/6)
VRDYPEYYAWFSIREFIWNNIKQDNRNGLLERDPSVDGMKTGHTDSAGYCLVTSAKRQDMRLIAVVLGSQHQGARGRQRSADQLRLHLLRERQRQATRGTVVLKPRVFKAERGVFSGRPGDFDVNIVVPRGQGGSIQTNASVRRPLIAPLSTHHGRGRAAGQSSAASP